MEGNNRMKTNSQNGSANESVIGNQGFLEVSPLKRQGKHSKQVNITASLETDIELVYQGRRRFLAPLTVFQQDLQVQSRHPWVVQTPHVCINLSCNEETPGNADGSQQGLQQQNPTPLHDHRS
jgi:hypothetical protein